MTTMPKPRVALAMDPKLTPDLFGPDQLSRLEQSCTLLASECLTDFSSETARMLLAEVEILLTGWGAPKLDDAVLDAAPQLRLVAHTGSSVKGFVATEVWHRGVLVVSAAAANAIPVAEFALAAILLANKGAFAAQRRFSNQRSTWLPQWIAPSTTGNLGARVGIVGASRTGRTLLKLLSAFDCDVLVFDPFMTAEEARALGAHKVSLEELMRSCRTVSVHAPGLPQTHHMIGAEELAWLADGSTLINTARGSVVDQLALERELVDGRLCAVLDVTDPEPLSADSPLYDLHNVFLTPHLAGAAGHETRRMADLAIEEIERFINGEPLRHAISLGDLTRIG